MSGVATAIAGAAVVGAVVQRNASNKASKSADRKAQSELEFAQQQYQDWQDVFGPIQDNLSDYYKNLSPDYVASVGLQNVEQERVAALDRINESLAQRGLLGSGLEAAAITDVELETAQQKAKVRSDAPQIAAQQKLGFLSLGMGQNPAGVLQNTLSNRANQSRQYAIGMQQAAGEAAGSAITTAGTALADYFRKNQNQPATTVAPPASNLTGTAI